MKKTNGRKSKKTAKRRLKDSVFCDLFSDKSYVLQLYKDLHPEDQDADICDVDIKTLKWTFINSLCNDLGFTIGDKYVLLVEAQSVWDVNITLRMLFYTLGTYQRYVAENGLNLHSNKPLSLPKAELYVVYTGKKDVPDFVSFNETFFGGTGSLDVRVKVLKGDDVATIYGQYIGLCHVYDEQREIYGNAEECAKETIRICLEKGYLVAYLKKHRTEVADRLEDLFDEEKLREINDREKEEEILKRGREEGLEKGREEGRAEERTLIINRLIQAGVSPDVLSQALNLEGGLPSVN